MKGLLIGLACAAALTDCAADSAPRPATVLAAPSPTPDFIDCGTFTYAQGEQRSAGTADCIVSAARARRVARLIETSPTVEGDPIVNKYATNTRGHTAVVTDSRADKFGTHDVVLQTFTTTERKGSDVLLEHRQAEVELWPPPPTLFLGKDAGILRPLETEHECGFRSPLPDRPELHGLTLAAVEKSERTLRVIGHDGVCNDRTHDFGPARTNVYLTQGRVAWAQMG